MMMVMMMMTIVIIAIIIRISIYNRCYMGSWVRFGPQGGAVLPVWDSLLPGRCSIGHGKQIPKPFSSC